MDCERFQGEVVRFLDTTLCDGARASERSLELDDRLEIAAALEALGVDAIEAGAPCASVAERRAVRAVARAAQRARVCARVRAEPDAIDAAGAALAPARAPRLHVAFGSGEEASPERVRACVERARRYTDDVQLSAADAFRLERAALAALARAALAAGAATFNLCDTSGCAHPGAVAERIATLRSDVPELAGATVAFRGRNDLGLATANSLAAIGAGARQVDVSVNGLGEGAGHAPLEEVAVALAVHGQALGVHTRVAAHEIGRASRIVERASGVAVPAHKAIVGRHVFRRAAAGDAHPVAEQRGLARLAGPRGFAARLRALGIELAGEDLERAFERFERLAERRPDVPDAELRRICAPREAWPGPGI